MYNVATETPGSTHQLTFTTDRYTLTAIVTVREKATTRWWVELHKQYPEMGSFVMAMLGCFAMLSGILLFTCLFSWLTR